MSQFSETKIHDSPPSQAVDSSSPSFALEKILADHQSVEPIVRGGEPDSSRQFRREVEREYRAEIRQLREESAAKDRMIILLQAEFVQLKTEFHSYQEANQKPLEVAQAMAEASRTMQKMMAVLVAILMAIGGTAASIEAFRKWWGNP